MQNSFCDLIDLEEDVAVRQGAKRLPLVGTHTKPTDAHAKKLSSGELPVSFHVEAELRDVLIWSDLASD